MCFTQSNPMMIIKLHVLQHFLKSTGMHLQSNYKLEKKNFKLIPIFSHDVLIFLTGQEEIEAVAHQIRLLAKDPEVEGPPLRVCTLYAAQPSSQQMSVFNPSPANMRKVIISTNIAETSVTITGIKYIIDCGMVKAR
jgi:HrpA-like RNA helicase